MSRNNFIVIKTFTNLVDAQVAKSKLDAYEIPSWLDNENVAAINWFLINVTGGIRLRVEQDNAEEALKVLCDVEEATQARTILTRHKYNKSRIAWVTIIALLLGLLFFGIF